MSVSHGWRLLKRQSGLVCDRPHVARLTSQHGGLQWPLWEGPGALFSPALPVTVTKGYIGLYHLPGGPGWSQPAPSICHALPGAAHTQAAFLAVPRRWHHYVLYTKQ